MTKKEFYNSLSDEVKAKIRACKTEEEMLEVLGDASVELDPELLEGVSGGSAGLGTLRSEDQHDPEAYKKRQAAEARLSDDCSCD